MQDISEKFKDFSILDFPQDASAVYVIFCIKENEELPVYVGETSGIHGRIGYYVSANFSAATDFKVGEAIKYFLEKGCKVTIRYKCIKAEHRRDEEKKIIDDLQGVGYELLNNLEGYNYKTANKEKERQKIKSFCDNILKGLQSN